MKLSEYVAQHGDKAFCLRDQALETLIVIYGSDPERGCYTDLTEDGWIDFADLAEYALAHGSTHIEHNTWPDGQTLHTDRIPLERETTA